MTRLSISVLALAGFAALTTACSDPPPVYPDCRTDADCRTGENTGKPESCVNRTCQECMAPADCPGGFTCTSGRCEIDVECRDDSGCGPGMTCMNGLCEETYECTSDAMCGSGMACVNGLCEEHYQCLQDGDCGTGFECSDHVCVSRRCVNSVECGPGYYCADGRCSPGDDPTLVAGAWRNACDVADSGEPSEVRFEPVLFDFNRFEIRLDMESVVDGTGDCLVGMLGSQVFSTITLEGHADERGTQEYNLALGEDRARAVKEAIVRRYPELSDKLRVHSWGEERPVCRRHMEPCWHKNRRVELTVE